MYAPPFAFLSNQVECLYKRLRQNLFQSAPPFTKRLIIVPSPAMRSWLMLQMAKDPELGISAGLEIGDIDSTINRICELADQEISIKYSEEELALAIEVEIRALLQKAQQICAPLLLYLNGPDTQRKEKRIVSLSMELARIFNDYGKYGQAMIEEWAKTSDLGWQQVLWQRLEKRLVDWQYPCRKLNHLKPFPSFEKGEVQVHLFALSFISRLHHQFFYKIHSDIPVSYYLLSPCQKFWSDILSNKESQKLKKYWKKREVSQEQQFALDEYLRDSNHLLANFGRMGREMALQVELCNMQTQENYLLPSSILEIAQYEELVTDEIALKESEQPLTLLEAVQADMVLLRNPESSPKIEFEIDDQSFQIHMAPKIAREVEILYNTILGIIEKHAEEKDPICPGDIIVLAPNIANYEPYIKKTFHGSDSVLDAQMIDLSMPSQNLTAQAFLHLLRLPFGRWDAAEMMQLFEYPAFQRYHQFSIEDILQIRQWITDLGIRWGNSLAHRKELLKRAHCGHELIEDGEEGTWEYGFKRLLEALCGQFDDSVYVESSQGGLLGKFIKIVRSLFLDLKPLSDTTRFSLSEWAIYLNCLFQAYLASDEEETKQILEHIDFFRRADKGFETGSFSFISIKEHFENRMQHQSVSYRENHLQAVRFCSLKPMRTIPGKVIVLMGMNEGEFPRQNSDNSLNLLSTHPKADYSPSQVDFDRTLFLEVLLSARRYFILSYVGKEAPDSKESPPSLLITELISYLDQSFTIQGAKTSDSLFYKHPFFSFDQVYFTAETRFPSFSKKQFQAAKAYYGLEKLPTHKFVPHFHLFSPVNPAQELIIDLKDLSAFARNPLKSYFNKTLGIYFEKEEDRLIKTEEEWLLSHLDLHLWEKKAVLYRFEDVLEQALKSGTFPQGAFKKISIDRLKSNIDDLQNFITELKITPESVFEIELDPFCQKAYRDEKVFKVPALTVADYPNIKIVGKLNYVSSCGLMLYSKNDFVSRAKIWPQLVVFSCLQQRDRLPITDQWIFLKSRNVESCSLESPESILKDFLDYYFKGLHSPSPLIPEWVQPMIKFDQTKFDQAVSKMAEDTSRSYNDYLKWLIRGRELPEEKGYANWRPIALNVFGKIQGGNDES